MQWYYEKDGAQAGPVEDGELGTLVRAGVIRGDTLVWRDGMRDWEPAHLHVRGLSAGALGGTALGRNYTERVGMGEALRRFFLNYVNFRGRSNRGEYWWTVLGLVLISIVISIVERAAGLGGPSGGPVSAAFNLATILPSMSLSARRLHDVDRRGWWMLAPLVPLLLIPVFVPWRDLASLGATPDPAALEQALGGTLLPIGFALVASVVLWILLFVWYCRRPTPGPNRFG